MGLYSLAHALHKTVAEIEQMTHKEYLGWFDYFSSIGESNKPKNMLDDPQALMRSIL